MSAPLWLPRAARFLVSGVVATGVHVGVALLVLAVAGSSPVLANGVAFAVATLFSYVLNTLWSFSSRIDRRTLLRFLAVSFAGCLLSMAVAALAEQAGLAPLTGILWVVLVVPPATFALHHGYTYR